MYGAMCKKRNYKSCHQLSVLAHVPLFDSKEYQTSPSVTWASRADRLVNNTGSTLKKFGLKTLIFNERKHKGGSFFYFKMLV